MSPCETIETEVLIAGGGGAGTRAAIEAAEQGAKVLLVNKGPLARSGLTTMAGGGVAAVMGDHPEDSPRSHFEDTIKRGHYLGDQNLVEVLTEEAPARLQELEGFGAKGPPHPLLHKTGHSHPRGLFLKGHRIMTALKEWASCHADNLTIWEDALLTRLLTAGGQVAGAVAFDMREGKTFVIKAKAVIVATGGLGELFPYTTNAPHGIAGDSTGSGVAQACAIGAKLVDMEFIQFYPAIGLFPPILRNVHLNLEIATSLLGGTLRNAQGEAFLEEFVKRGVMVRDVSTRLAYEEIKGGRGTEHGGLYWDAGMSADLSMEEIVRKVSEEYGQGGILSTGRRLKAIGHSLAEPLEFRCGAHFACGGIQISEKTETNIPGLYAAGEATGGIHGANRLAGNAVPDLLVFGKRAGENAAAYARSSSQQAIDESEVRKENERIFGYLEGKPNGISVKEIRRDLQQVVDDCLGPSRNGPSLVSAAAHIQGLNDGLPRIQVANVKEFNITWVRAIETPHMLALAEVIARSSLLRTESRGNHQREDYPRPDNRRWLRHTVAQLKDDDLEMTTTPVVITRLEPPWE
jgi:succinate dehydrogenase/fumarate reductase flavoprotein subunit